MLGLGWDAHFPEFLVDLSHVTADSLTEGSEVMIVKLLSLRRHGTEQGTAGIDQVFSLQIFITVNQEILLLGADGGYYLAGCSVSKKPKET